MNFEALIYSVLAVGLSPLLFGIINRTKAFFAGRRGRPLLQLYFDIFKLLRKGAVYSTTTSWVFKFLPALTVGVMILCSGFLPIGHGGRSLIAFQGDLIFFIYLFGLTRFFIILATFDTGSSFCVMGSSREAFFSALAEPALLLCLVTISKIAASLSLSEMYSSIDTMKIVKFAPVILLVMISLFITLLSENSRIPVDDPETHLELTMIHEVMVLDYSGPDLALIFYGSALKFWLLGSLIIGLILPFGGNFLVSRMVLFLAGMILIGILVGIVESCMARLRMTRVPQLLIGAGALSIFALIMLSTI